MIVFKGFAPGLISVCGKSRHDQLKHGKNIEKEANCRQNGFHAAEDPLDCLCFYRWDGKNEFYRCEAGGDIDEIDGMISCTEITICERLTLERFVAEAMRFRIRHPSRPEGRCLEQEVEASNGWAIARGRNPSAVGQNGDILGFLREDKRGVIVGAALKKVGKGGLTAGISYTLDEDGRVRPDGRVIECD